MVETQEINIYLAKAEESLAGAESELGNHRYNNCANRCYDSCFQGAVAALLMAGIHARSSGGHWRHQTVHAQFVEQLINRRRNYPPSLRTVMSEVMLLRQVAEYEADSVSQKQATRALRRSSEFVEVIRRNWEKDR